MSCTFLMFSCGGASCLLQSPKRACTWVICIMWSMPRVGWSWWWGDCGTVTSHLPAGHLLSHEGIAWLACHSPTRLRHQKISSNKIPNLTFCLCMIYVVDWAPTFLVKGFCPPHFATFPPKVELFEEVRKTNPIQKVWTKSVHWWKDAVLEQRGRRSG